MKQTVIISLLLIWANIFCFSQTSFYSEGIGFEYNKRWEFSQKKDKDKDITYISSSNIVIMKLKAKKDIQVNVEKSLEKWGDEKEEQYQSSGLKIRQRSEITDRTIGAAAIATKSIDFELYDRYGKNVSERLYAFEQADYLIMILIIGKINSDINMILNSFWFMPEKL